MILFFIFKYLHRKKIKVNKQDIPYNEITRELSMLIVNKDMRMRTKTNYFVGLEPVIKL